MSSTAASSSPTPLSPEPLSSMLARIGTKELPPPPSSSASASGPVSSPPLLRLTEASFRVGPLTVDVATWLNTIGASIAFRECGCDARLMPNTLAAVDGTSIDAQRQDAAGVSGTLTLVYTAADDADPRRQTRRRYEIEARHGRWTVDGSLWVPREHESGGGDGGGVVVPTPKTDERNTRAEDRRLVADAFLFYNELDMLEARLREFDACVDYFVLVESTFTFNGQRKPLFFAEHRARFSEWASRIVHVVVRDDPTLVLSSFSSSSSSSSRDTDELALTTTIGPGISELPAWLREYHQRNALQHGVHRLGLRAHDLLVLADVDEVPPANFLHSWRDARPVRDSPFANRAPAVALKQALFYYDFAHLNAHTSWCGPVVGTYACMRTRSMQDWRHARHQLPKVEHGGWHCSYFGTSAFISNKIRQFAHQEYNSPGFTDEKAIERRVALGRDLFDQPDVRHTAPARTFALPRHWRLMDPRASDVKLAQRSLEEDGDVGSDAADDDGFDLSRLLLSATYGVPGVFEMDVRAHLLRMASAHPHLRALGHDSPPALYAPSQLFGADPVPGLAKVLTVAWLRRVSSGGGGGGSSSGGDGRSAFEKSVATCARIFEFNDRWAGEIEFDSVSRRRRLRQQSALETADDRRLRLSSWTATATTAAAAVSRGDSSLDGGAELGRSGGGADHGAGIVASRSLQVTFTLSHGAERVQSRYEAPTPPTLSPTRRRVTVRLLSGLCNQIYEFAAAALVAARTGRVLVAPRMLVRRTASDNVCGRDAWFDARDGGYAHDMEHLVDVRFLHTQLARLGVLFVTVDDASDDDDDGNRTGSIENDSSFDPTPLDAKPDDRSGAVERERRSVSERLRTVATRDDAPHSLCFETQVYPERSDRRSAAIAVDFDTQSPNALLISPFCSIRVERQADCEFMTRVLRAVTPCSRLAALADRIVQALVAVRDKTRRMASPNDSPSSSSSSSSQPDEWSPPSSTSPLSEIWAIHARTESDWPEPRLSATSLAELVRARAHGNVGVVYVVGQVAPECGRALGDCAPEFRWVTKASVDVLGGDLRDALRALKFEEAAMVDRAVAVSPRLRTFVGLDNSSFSQTIAVERDSRRLSYSMYTVAGGGTMGCDRGLLFARHAPLARLYRERPVPDFTALVAHIRGPSRVEPRDQATCRVANTSSVASLGAPMAPPALAIETKADEAKADEAKADEVKADAPHVLIVERMSAEESATTATATTALATGDKGAQQTERRATVPPALVEWFGDAAIHLHVVARSEDLPRVSSAATSATAIAATTTTTVYSGIGAVLALKQRLGVQPLRLALDRDTDASVEARVAALEHLMPQMAPGACYALELSAADARDTGAGDTRGFAAAPTTPRRQTLMDTVVDVTRRLQTRLVDDKSVRPSALSDMVESVTLLEAFIVIRRRADSDRFAFSTETQGTTVAATEETAAAATTVHGYREGAGEAESERKEEKAATATAAVAPDGGGGGGGSLAPTKEATAATADSVTHPSPLPAAAPSHSHGSPYGKLSASGVHSSSNDSKTEPVPPYPLDLAPGELPRLDNAGGRWWPRDARLLWLVHQYDGDVAWARRLRHPHVVFEKHKPAPHPARAPSPFVAPNVAKAETNLLQFCAVFYDDLPPLVGQLYQYERKHCHRGSLADLCNRPQLETEVRDAPQTPGFLSLNCERMGAAQPQHARMAASGWWRACMAPYFGVRGAASPAALGNWTQNKMACAQFVVSRDRIRSLPRAFYADMFAWLVRNGTGEPKPLPPDAHGNRAGSQRELSDYASHFWTSRYLEWTWELIFTSVKRHEIPRLAVALPWSSGSASDSDDDSGSDGKSLAQSSSSSSSSSSTAVATTAAFRVPRITVLYGSRYFMRDCTRAALARGLWNRETCRLTVPPDLNFNAAFGDGHWDTPKQLHIHVGAQRWALGETRTCRFELVFSRRTGRVRRTEYSTK